MQNQTGGPTEPGQDDAFMAVRIWRGDAAGRYQTYRVPRLRNQTVLDVVTWVQRHLEPSAGLPLCLPGWNVRFLCHDGERPARAGPAAPMSPRSPATGPIDASRPLRNLPKYSSDLVGRYVGLLREVAEAPSARFATGGTASRHDPPEAGPRRTARHGAAPPTLAIECINCAVCYAACDVVGPGMPDYRRPRRTQSRLDPRAMTNAIPANAKRLLDGGRRWLADATLRLPLARQLAAEHCPVGNQPDPGRSRGSSERASPATSAKEATP